MVTRDGESAETGDPSPAPIEDMLVKPLDALAKFLGYYPVPQPAYAGYAGSLSGTALNDAAGRNIYNSSNSSNVSTTNVPPP